MQAGVYDKSFIGAISDTRTSSCENRRWSYQQRRLKSKYENGQCNNALELLDEIQHHMLKSGVIPCNVAISLCEKDEDETL